MDFISAFKDFGFPALVVGVLLWMYSTKLERLVSSNEAMKDVLSKLDVKVDGIKADVQSLRENTRPRGGRT